MLKANCFIDLLDTPMGRRNSYLCFANANEGGSQFGKNTLYLATCKSGGSGMADLMREFLAEVVGVCVMIATAKPEAKRVDNVRSLLILEGFDPVTGCANIHPAEEFR